MVNIAQTFVSICLTFLVCWQHMKNVKRDKSTANYICLFPLHNKKTEIRNFFAKVYFLDTELASKRERRTQEEEKERDAGNKSKFMRIIFD